jgi:hypothetical protein
MIGVPQAARIAGIELHDYGRQGASGVLVTSGTGIMLGIMDVAPCLRWCTDLDAAKGDRERDFFLRLIDGEAPVVAVAGWWTVSNPEPVRRALAQYRRSRLVVHANVPLVEEGQATGLEALIAELQAIAPVPASPPGLSVSRLGLNEVLSYDHHWV